MSYIGKVPINRTLGLSQKNLFTGDGSTTSFDMTSAAPEGGDTAVDVFVDNVRQEPGIGKGYILASDGTDFKRITFSAAPVSGAVIWTNNRLRTQITGTLPSAATVTNTMLNTNVVTGFSALGTAPASADTFLVYDDDAGALKKVAYSNVHSGVADMAANTVKVRDAATTGAPSDKAVATTEILIGDGTGFTAAALSSDVTMTNAGAVTIAADAVTYAKMQNLATANRVLGSASTGLIGEVQIATDMVADNAVTIAKMAGLVRGKIIVGDASGDPSALTVGTANQVLTSDGTDAAWAAAATELPTQTSNAGKLLFTNGSAASWSNSIPTLNLDGTTEGSPAEGDFWYDSGKFYFGTDLVYIGVWSSGGNMTYQRGALAGDGTQTAAWAAGGDGDVVGLTNKTEEYDGTAWSDGGNLGTATRNLPAGAGTLTAGLISGGWTGATVTNRTEEYNGTSWSGGGNMVLARDWMAGCGTQVAGLNWGGQDYPVENRQDSTEEYDGSSWSTSNDLPNASRQLGGCGTQTAGLSIGGNTASITYDDATLEYNGTSWSVGGDLGTGRYYVTGFGLQTAAGAAGGTDGSTLTSTEEYDGTSWSAGGNLLVARASGASAGTLTAGLIFGGSGLTTEEYAEGSATFDQLFSAPGGL